MKAFLEKLRSSHVGPSGQINKLATLKRAAQYIISMLPDDSSEEDRQTLYKCNPVMAKAARDTKTLQKEKKEILATKRDLIAKEDVSAEDVSFIVYQTLTLL